MDINNPIPAQWSGYVTQTNLGLEIIPHVLYSVKDYEGGVTRQLTFFDFARGSRGDLTNMQNAGSLPNPESMLIQNIRVYFWKAVQSDDSGDGDSTTLVSGFNDVVQLATHGILEMKIGNKQYGPWPLWTLPAHNFVKGAFASGSDLAADYGQIDGFLYSLFPNLCLSPIQPFSVTLSWPAGPIALSTDGETSSLLPIEVLFDGQLARSIQ